LIPEPSSELTEYRQAIAGEIRKFSFRRNVCRTITVVMSACLRLVYHIFKTRTHSEDTSAFTASLQIGVTDPCRGVVHRIRRSDVSHWRSESELTNRSLTILNAQELKRVRSLRRSMANDGTTCGSHSRRIFDVVLARCSQSSDEPYSKRCPEPHC
jgi:hypothetical protein